MLAGQRAVEDPVLELDQRAQPLRVAVAGVEQLADHLERQEALLLELLDQPDPLDELRRVVGHVAARLDRLRQQALAQVVAHGRHRHAGRLGQLRDLQQLRRVSVLMP